MSSPGPDDDHDTQAARDAGPLTRAGLRDGSLLAAARTRAVPQFPVLSDQEIATSLHATLSGLSRDKDIWVFGYGSLIWNPMLEYVEKRPALLRGWHRRFCLLSTGRGSPERPGLMLALDEGGECRGLAFRIEASRVEEELSILWHREMLNGSYLARRLDAESERGDIEVLAFVANHDHPRFTGDLSESEIAERIAFSRGPSGSGVEYLRNTIASLAAHGLDDAGLERIRLHMEARLAGAP